MADYNKLIIHAGLHKTGTSTIQLFLSQNAKLLSEHGWVYPLTRGPLADHNFLPGMLRAFALDTLPPSNKEKLEQFRKGTASMCAQTGHAAVLSGEEFGTDFASDRKCRYWSEYFSQDFDAQVVYYIRRPDHYQESAFAEIVKGWYVGSIQDFPTKVNWFKRLSPTLKYFGRRKVYLRPYNKRHWLNKSLIDDFLNILDIPYKQEAVPTENQSLSRRKTLLLSAIDKTKLEDKVAFVDALRRSEAVTDDGCRYLLSPVDREQLYCSVREENQNLLTAVGSDWDVDEFFGYDESEDEEWFPPEPVLQSEIDQFWEEMGPRAPSRSVIVGTPGI